MQAPGYVPEKTRIRMMQEKRYEKSVLALISREKDTAKIAELQEELLLCRRRMDAFVSVYPGLQKLKDE
jgi:hypothetical protein